MKFIIENNILLAVKDVGENERKLVIPDGVKTIGFQACKSLEIEEVVISEGVERIGVSAFECCPYLKKVSIPASCWRMEDKAFYDCKALETVRIASEDILIGEDVFAVIATSTYDERDFILEPNRPVYNIEENFPITFLLDCENAIHYVEQIVNSMKLYSWIAVQNEVYDAVVYGPHYKQRLHGKPLEKRKYTMIAEWISQKILAPEYFPEKVSRFGELFGPYECSLKDGNYEELIITYGKTEKRTEPVSDCEVYAQEIRRENDRLIDILARAGKDVVHRSVRRPANYGLVYNEGTLVIPEGVIDIRQEDYSDYAGAKHIIFPETLMIIHMNAFSNFTVLESVEFKSRPLYISERAFYNTPFYYFAKEKLESYCDRSIYADFGKDRDLDEVDFNFIWGITRLFEERMAVFVDKGVRYLFDKKMKAIVLCNLEDSDKTELFIPAEIEGVAVENIGVGAFTSLMDIVRIDIPSSVKMVEWRAFAGCTSLHTIQFHNEAESVFINPEIFHNCVSLQQVCFEKYPTLSSKWSSDSGTTYWNYLRWKMNYDPVHEDSNTRYSPSEMLEKVMFKAPFPQIHINQMSDEDRKYMNVCFEVTGWPTDYSTQFIKLVEIED